MISASSKTYQLKLIFIFISFSITFSGCNEKKKIEKVLIGQFGLKSVNYSDKELLYNLNLNIIEFFKNGTLRVPKINNRNNGVIPDTNTAGTWELQKRADQYLLYIKTNSIYFNGVFKVKFKKMVENQDLVLELYADSMQLTGTQGYFLYRFNMSNVNDAVKLTE